MKSEDIDNFMNTMLRSVRSPTRSIDGLFVFLTQES